MGVDSSSTYWPTFLGIGVPKAGTTWLYEVLDSHPHVWVPKHEREVHYFNRYYENRGFSWYKQFFPRSEKSTYQAVGEITPSYLYCDSERIGTLKSELPSVEKLILVFRNPVDRLYSAYWFRRRIENLNLSFREFVEERPEVVEQGRYARYLKRWLHYFDRDQFLILTTELDLEETDRALGKLASFLGVDPDAFPTNAGASKENSRYMPRFERAYAWAIDLNRKLKRANVYWPSFIAHALGVPNWFGRREVEDEMNPQFRQELSSLYTEDVDNLEEMLGREFTEWGL